MMLTIFDHHLSYVLPPHNNDNNNNYDKLI